MAIGNMTVKVKLEDLNDLALVAALINRNKLADAPSRTERYGKWHEVVIGIGKDDVAYLTLTDKALESLQRLLPGA